MLLEQRITDVHLIQGQPIAVCAVKHIDEQGDRYESRLWTFSLDGSDSRCLTQGPGLDDQPRWSPDGHHIAFTSTRAGGPPELYRMEVRGGEARRLTSTAMGVQSHAWRPDGQQLLACCPVAVDPDRRREGAEDVDPRREPRPKDAPQLVWRLPYKLDGAGYLLDQRIHLFLVDAETGRLDALTRGDFDVMQAAWSPDGRRIAYSRTRDAEREEHCSDLWLIDVDERGPAGSPRRLTREQAVASSLSWSPDGRWLAFTGSVNEGDAQIRLWLCDVEKGRVQPLGDKAIEVAPGELQWRRDGRSLAFLRARNGLQEIATIAVPGGEVASRPEHLRHVMHLAVNERVAFTAESATEPLELYSADWDGDHERRLSHFNRWWDERRPLRAERRRFEVPDGDGGLEKVDGWLLQAADRQKRSGPLLVDVHGGPASYAPLSFPVHAYWPLLASRGWSILALNPVGSSSYGRPIAERLRARWGELDLPQQQAAIKSLQDEGIVDDRVAIAGSSYGGYLSAWAIGTCRIFRAAVVSAPVGNLEAHYGTSDSGFYADPYSMDGKPHANRELMSRLSPMIHIEKACTPTLFIQGQDDERCPVGQSEEMFVKLQRTGVPTELLLYPGGSHHLQSTGRPSHRLHALRRIVDWLERWIAEPLSKGPASER